MVENKAVVSEELIDERMANAMLPGAMDSARAIFGTLRDSKLLEGEVPLWARVHGITHPTLITWGRDDRMVMYEGAHLAFRQLPNAELHVFSNCGHWAQVERKADFERLVIEFLTRPD
jgi:4,5:9,10-diseco-3-hydroxy-5,9,17-trioxoandrosta-1(10),2-diene-4-oate hydrolase